MRLRQAWIVATCAAALAVAIVLAPAVARAQETAPALGEKAPPPAPASPISVAATPAPTASAVAPAAVEGMIERGAYLARIGGCNDCHTPLKMGEKGPEPDMDRMLSGHPESLEMPPPPALPKGPWGTIAATTNTAFAGTWGVSYATNLTPDKDTGMGAWTQKTFVETMRTGKHWGVARPILPPMPWRNVAILTDDDLRSLFRYLTSIPSIKNQVPEAVVAKP